jgi:ABC-2 type transport system permease protein
VAVVVVSLLSMVASYTLVALLFDAPLRVEQPLLFAVSLLFTVISFVCFGLMLAPVFLMNPAVQRWQNAMEFPIYILSGFLFPIALLPGWTTPLSYLLAPYWAARALHGTTSGGAPPAATLQAWGMMLLFSLAYVLISGQLMRVMLRRARAEATLGLE